MFEANQPRSAPAARFREAESMDLEAGTSGMLSPGMVATRASDEEVSELFPRALGQVGAPTVGDANDVRDAVTRAQAAPRTSTSAASRASASIAMRITSDVVRPCRSAKRRTRRSVRVARRMDVGIGEE
jgi:hypothetical protein